jgi:hypothetical protein
MFKRFIAPLRSVLLTLVISVLSCSGVLAQQIFTFSDRDSVRVGDIIELTFVIQGNYMDLSQPDESVFPDEVELLSRQRYQTASNRDSLVYRLQFFGTDDLLLPALPFEIQRTDGDTTLNTTRIPIYFKTMLSEEDDSFRPFKPVFDFARTWWPYLLLTLLLIAIGYYLYTWFQKREPEPERPVIPDPTPFLNPLEQLKKAISNLNPPQALSEYEEYEEFYIKLGDAIRRYIKRVYEFPALEMTTGEICRTLQSEHADSNTIRITRTVLNEADIVKFAHFKPDTESAQNVLQRAKEFYNQARTLDSGRIDRLRMEYEQKNEQNTVSVNPAAPGDRSELQTDTENTKL